METVKQEFKSGDIVRYIPMGDKEYVLEGINSGTHPLWIEGVGIFTLDGRVSAVHIHPLLILIRRPEKKKYYQVFYKLQAEERPDVSPSLYESEEDFYTLGILKNRLEWIELKFVCER